MAVASYVFGKMFGRRIKAISFLIFFSVLIGIIWGSFYLGAATMVAGIILVRKIKALKLDTRAFVIGILMFSLLLVIKILAPEPIMASGALIFFSLIALFL